MSSELQRILTEYLIRLNSPKSAPEPPNEDNDDEEETHHDIEIAIKNFASRLLEYLPCVPGFSTGHASSTGDQSSTEYQLAAEEQSLAPAGPSPPTRPKSVRFREHPEVHIIPQEACHYDTTNRQTRKWREWRESGKKQKVRTQPPTGNQGNGVNTDSDRHMCISYPRGQCPNAWFEMPSRSLPYFASLPAMHAFRELTANWAVYGLARSATRSLGCRIANLCFQLEMIYESYCRMLGILLRVTKGPAKPPGPGLLSPFLQAAEKLSANLHELSVFRNQTQPPREQWEWGVIGLNILMWRSRLQRAARDVKDSLATFQRCCETAQSRMATAKEILGSLRAAELAQNGMCPSIMHDMYSTLALAAAQDVEDAARQVSSSINFLELDDIGRVFDVVNIEEDSELQDMMAMATSIQDLAIRLMQHYEDMRSPAWAWLCEKS
ncbi:hypothetical protein QBC34DRAFT_377024 [Podospora aff. communis PSN243]|uniref:Uncharacterized protein n=1 Tax=Podospora aff. communis PSN243 TaxID=3040156 RepID=A0AAV9GWZ9_9PEZI|nr:hypothetical protein QBC34DRAFT_377024 [Podospora aff. communis PSN243]